MTPPRASTSFTRCPFADTPDGRIARHLPQGIDTVGQQQGIGAHTRGRQGSLGPRHGPRRR